MNISFISFQYVFIVSRRTFLIPAAINNDRSQVAMASSAALMVYPETNMNKSVQ